MEGVAQVAISGELACMALFLLAFLVTAVQDSKEGYLRKKHEGSVSESHCSLKSV